jgi:hypothetical protein
MREKYLPEQRTIAVAEELAAFLRTELIDAKGRFSVAITNVHYKISPFSRGSNYRRIC